MTVPDCRNCEIVGCPRSGSAIGRRRKNRPPLQKTRGNMRNMITMVTVSDMDRSVRFYRDVLGLKLKFQSPDWSEFDLGPNTLALHGGGTPAPPPSGKEQLAGRASIGFNVEDLD